METEEKAFRENYPELYEHVMVITGQIPIPWEWSKYPKRLWKPTEYLHHNHSVRDISRISYKIKQQIKNKQVAGNVCPHGGPQILRDNYSFSWALAVTENLSDEKYILFANSMKFYVEALMGNVDNLETEY